MATTRYVAQRWPDREFEIHRLGARDDVFRAVLSDYEEARAALERWSAARPTDAGKTADYAEIARELEDEIETRLAAEATRPRAG